MCRCILHPSRFVLIGSAMLAIVVGALSCVRARAANVDLDQARKRAEQGSVQDQIELGAAYLTGEGAPQNASLSAYWYEKAAGGGSAESEDQIGSMYQAGLGVPAKIERAVYWYRLAAAAGLTRAKVNLGLLYLKGDGVPKDPTMAQHFFHDAVRKHFGAGATCLGHMYFLGLGVPKDVPAAQKWYEKGVKLDDPEAAYNLAILYSTSEYHRHDLRKATGLLRRAIYSGYVPAMHALAMLLNSHPELAHSQKEQRALLEKAAKAGNWRSSVMLGILARDGQRDGKTVKADPAAAYYHFRVAAMQGGAAGRKLLTRDLDTLAAQIGTEQEAALNSKAEAWYPRHQFAFVFILKMNDPSRYFPVVSVEEGMADSTTTQ